MDRKAMRDDGDVEGQQAREEEAVNGLEEPFFMEDDSWWYTDKRGQARLSPDAPMKARKSYWKWIGSDSSAPKGARDGKSLMYFEYEVWAMGLDGCSFERSGGDVVAKVTECFQEHSYPGHLEDMVELKGLIEKHGLLKWPRVSSRPEDVIVLDGARWKVEFAFSDGILHTRRGQTCGEPEEYGAFAEELEVLVERVVARGGKVADGPRKED